ncbi:MAG: hypothetical protein ACMUJM_00385 [bacterium]
MSIEIENHLSESTKNIIENLACRISEKNGGTITPNHLMPYLPMSLRLIKSCLDSMVDGTSVFSERKDNITEYECTAYKNMPIQQGELEVDSCISCGKELLQHDKKVLCPHCFDSLNKELSVLAESIGWPAQAVYEHEILYLAALQKGPLPIESLAGRSQYPIQRMRKKLNTMSIEGYLKEEVDQETGIITYSFPPIRYSIEDYLRNIGIVRSYPASVMEEVQLKIVRILFSLGLIFLGSMIMAFLFHIPYPFLVLLLCIATPLTSILIWRHKRSASLE